jgi:monoamine oxidase
VDVAIVGAGFSGLYAARELVRAGRDVVVLEARDRVGGRTLTVDVDGHAIDLGGQWIGDKHERLRALAAELGVATFPQYADGKKVLVRRDGKLRTFSGFLPKVGLISLVELGIKLGALEKLCKKVPLEDPMAAPEAAALDAQTVAEWLEANVRTTRTRDMLGLAAQMILAAEPREISMLYFLLYAHAGAGMRRLAEIRHGAQDQRFTGGAQLIAQKLAAELGPRVRLEHAVTAVEQSETSVTVHTTRGPIQAGRAILAVPPALLGKLDLGELSAARALLHTVPMGKVVKCVATYRKAFWRETGYSGEAFSTHGLVRATFDDCSADGSLAALVAFVVGDAAKELARQPESERRKLVLAELGRLHGPAAHQATAYVDHDWVGDPWSAGCYVGVMPPRILTQAAAFLRAPHGRLHFAGTETAIHHIGYLEGAIEAGERVAREVLSVRSMHSETATISTTSPSSTGA